MGDKELIIFQMINDFETKAKVIIDDDFDFYKTMKEFIYNLIDKYILTDNLLRNEDESSGNIVEYDLDETTNVEFYNALYNFNIFTDEYIRLLFQYCVKEYIEEMNEFNPVTFGLLFKFSQKSCKIIVTL